MPSGAAKLIALGHIIAVLWLAVIFLLLLLLHLAPPSFGFVPVPVAIARSTMAHAALVFDGDVAVGWCQFGTPEELPSIKHKKEYKAGLVSLPDYRLTCFFVDRDYRRKGWPPRRSAGPWT